MTDMMAWGWLRDVKRDEMTANLYGTADFIMNLLYGENLVNEMMRLEGRYVTIKGNDIKNENIPLKILVDSVQESQDPQSDKVQIKPLHLVEEYNHINRSIFDESDGSERVASVESDWNSLSGYRIAYQSAADKLVESLSDGFLEPDALIYPIMFLYRHCLELRVKELYLGMKILNQQENAIKMRSHDIKKFWKELRTMLELDWKDQATLLDNIEHRIMEFHDLDKKSFAFRYPVLLDGEEIVIRSSESPALLDLHAVGEIFADLDAVLEEIYLLIDDEITARRIHLW